MLGSKLRNLNKQLWGVKRLKGKECKMQFIPKESTWYKVNGMGYLNPWPSLNDPRNAPTCLHDPKNILGYRSFPGGWSVQIGHHHVSHVSSKASRTFDPSLLTCSPFHLASRESPNSSEAWWAFGGSRVEPVSAQPSGVGAESHGGPSLAPLAPHWTFWRPCCFLSWNKRLRSKWMATMATLTTGGCCYSL